MPRISTEQPASDDEPDVQYKEDRSRGEAYLREQRQPIPHWNIERMENLDAGKALQGGFYAVYDVHLAILPTAAGVGQSVLRWRYDRHPAAAVQAADYGANDVSLQRVDKSF